jgi:ferredoxin
MPVCELAATYPESTEAEDVKQFAVFGLKDCDIRSIQVLDKVFAEEEFKDPSYIERRNKMFVIASDCFDPAESCFCNVLGGRPFSESGYDLNVSKVRDGFVVEAGSEVGEEFLKKHSNMFNNVPDALMAERDKNRQKTQEQLEQNNAELKFDESVKDVVENSEESDVYDVEAKTCIECQACTRICPTCHCFYLYDTKQEDYFAKMKMWDSCMRLAYAAVAGGANPRKVLGDRLKHRLMHKFVYFLDRYGIEMCIGCGRCVDADAGGIDLRAILKKLSEELKDKKEAKVAK